jgi:hypothetical protein
MKNRIPLSLLLAGLFPLSGLAQLNNGGLYSLFGVDADTRANYMKYGLVTGSVTSDDWFSPSGAGNNVIDTSNAAFYRSQLQGGVNLGFSSRMSRLLYSKVSGKLWLDAVYGRDYIASASFKDSTTFTSVDKNGDNPNNWTGGISNFPTKDDLVDVYAHMRRDGTTIHDSLWLFTGASTVGVVGSRYFDVELYKNNFGYNSSTGVFTSAGPDAGHTQWIFDASGNLIQTGDMILAVSYNPGTAPAVDVRIWVSQTTFSTVTPANFNFSGTLSGSTPAFGYVSIVSKTGTTAFGAGIANYSATPAQDTTYATPWGTNGPGWSTQYQSLQFIEMGLNLTRIGIDPALYSALGTSACQSMFSDIFFTSRASASFTADMHDFVGPLTFLRSPVMDFSAQTDTLRCNRPTGILTLTDNSTIGYYTWQTPNGGSISGSNGDSSRLSITKPGTYIVAASPAQGCPPTRLDTLIVPIDTFPPVASAFAGASGPNIDLYGGNTAASNYLTPFGGSQGLTWDWSGPDSFSSVIQNPVRDSTGAWGTYHLTVTEKRNGCTDTASVLVTPALFVALLTNGMNLQGKASGHSIVLSWNDLDQANDLSFEIERSNGYDAFQPIGNLFNANSSSAPIPGAPTPGAFSFTDEKPAYGNNFYRIKAFSVNNGTYYSNIVTVGTSSSPLQDVTLKGLTTRSCTLLVNSAENVQGVLAQFGLDGQILEKKNITLASGASTIDMPLVKGQPVTIVVLFLNGAVAWTQKIALP